MKHRNLKLTINIKNKNKVIAQLLLNNMIPVNKENLKLVDIDKERYIDYLKSEIIYLKNEKVINEIVKKVQNMFHKKPPLELFFPKVVLFITITYIFYISFLIY